MIRKLTMLTAILLAIGGAFFAPGAEAQGEPTCPLFLSYEVLMLNGPVLDAEPGDEITGSADLRLKHDCADAVAYPGPFTNMPTVPLAPYAAAVGIKAAPAPVAAPAAAASPGLAHSGSETAVLAYLGTGLVAFGAFAMGIRRGNAGE